MRGRAPRGCGRGRSAARPRAAGRGAPGLERRVERGRAVEEARLLADADRLRLAQRRDGDDLDSLLGGEGVDGRAQRALAVAEVGAEPDVGARHGLVTVAATVPSSPAGRTSGFRTRTRTPLRRETPLELVGDRRSERLEQRYRVHPRPPARLARPRRSRPHPRAGRSSRAPPPRGHVEEEVLAAFALLVVHAVVPEHAQVANLDRDHATAAATVTRRRAADVVDAEDRRARSNAATAAATLAPSRSSRVRSTAGGHLRRKPSTPARPAKREIEVPKRIARCRDHGAGRSGRAAALLNGVLAARDAARGARASSTGCSR